jgi:hemin uptake protein HemP
MNSGGDSSGEDNAPRDVPMFSGNERRVRLLDNRVDSSELFVATREIMIVHGADTYRLRLTAQNKLILTK